MLIVMWRFSLPDDHRPHVAIALSCRSPEDDP
jgi:hypothetical protein